VENPNESAVLTLEIAQRLAEQLDFMKLQPKKILNLGDEFESNTRLLRQRYPQAEVITAGMIADVPALLAAVRDETFDLVFANLSFIFIVDLPAMFTAIRRSLNPKGLFLFSTMGPDTLKELKQCSAAIDNKIYVQPFVDMHNVGDALLQQGFLDPVMTMEQLTVAYTDVVTLFHDLRFMRREYQFNGEQGLLGKTCWQRFLHMYEQYRNEDNLIPATFEVVYGHAWNTIMQTEKVNAQNEVLIPVSKIQKFNH
jgi:malonyl-CoA O-methyltransferase